MATMHVELVSIEAPIWSGEATAVFARTTVGELGILPGHTPLLGALAPGYPVRIDQEDGEPIRVAVHGGFLSVSKEGVSVLAEQAELAEDVDVARARESLNSADPEQGPEEEAARNRALSRLRAAGEQV
ncbi:MAG: atpC [Jatrophihabitans sp.]|jgi:F-type H+-transporting ATPase subunit epsilon|nr:atpC [Jatrophihabitans sp.]MDT4903346.1 F-type H+-transporting ATPase subunit epsilon [Pseudonocardiales bacterium]MDT4929865.1 F-type H+-transporting ATPase subunit epsilon [Pseudonocardiales bacterium]MDT4950896.1 F-type H+-transporting ATPase subunit epsilon [Pseudonocardiales bacterium]